MSLTRFTSEAFSTAVSRKITQYKYIYFKKALLRRSGIQVHTGF